MLTEEEILEVLNEWNYWNKDFEDFVTRDEYSEKLRKIRKTGEIIVFTGIRRSGKSTLMKQEMKSLSQKYDKKQFLYVNFEDSRFIDNLNAKLLEKILEVYRKNINLEKEVFIFFDEIQEVQGWEKFVRTLYELKKANIYLTGSSSKMLSTDLSTAIAGRYIEIKVFPLTFGEFLTFNKVDTSSKLSLLDKKTRIKRLFDEFIRFGGFPKIALSDENSRNDLLLNYFDTILLKDIVSRHHLKNPDLLKKTAHMIATNDTKLTNINTIAKSVGISYDTCLNYITYLKETSFISEVKNFNYSIRKQVKSNSKFYIIDTGLINTISFRFKDDKGSLLENVVLNQLKRELNEVYYFTRRNECDFIVKMVNEVIQVCYDLNEKNEDREINGLLDAMGEFGVKKGMVLTYDQEDEKKVKGKKVDIKPVWKWLLE